MYPSFSLRVGTQRIKIITIEGDSHLTVECFDTDSCLLLIDNTGSVDCINRSFAIEKEHYTIRKNEKLDIDLKPFIEGKEDEIPHNRKVMQKSISVKYNRCGSVKIQFRISFKRQSRHSFEYYIAFDDGSVGLIPRRLR